MRGYRVGSWQLYGMEYIKCNEPKATQSENGLLFCGAPVSEFDIERRAGRVV